jgi:uncharacterized LabA/DUF88 family protein
MEKKKAIIFVDANNWYHNVKKIIKPSDIDFKKVASLICLSHNYDLKGIRWFVSTPSIADGETMYYRHMSFLSHLKKQGIEVITRKLQRLSNKEIQEKKKELIDSLSFCEVCKPLVEENFLELADIKRKEKGIDVWIAIDMVRKSLIEKDCDVAVIISGDADFVPALELIKESGKEVLSSFVPIGYSFELRAKFNHFFLGKKKIMDCLKDYKDIKSNL